MLYCHVETGNGDVEGESENSPPYSQSVSYEFQSEPIATAGGPDGCGRPFKDGDAICHVFVRSSVRKSLS